MGARETEPKKLSGTNKLVITGSLVATTMAGIAGGMLWSSRNENPGITIPASSSTTDGATTTLLDGTTTIPATTTTTEAPKLNLHALFAADIVSGIPTLDPVQVEAELRYFDSTFPEGLINVALAENSGLIAHSATGEVIPVLPPAYRNASEGGAWYGSWGKGKVSFDGRTYEFPNKVDNVYQTFVIGRPDDSTSEDLNTTIELTEYKAGHFYTNHLVPSHGEIIQDGRVINVPKRIRSKTDFREIVI